MRSSFRFEIKAIITLIAILIFVIIIGVLTYNRFTGIVNDISENSRPDLKLLSTKSLQSHLKQLENNAKTFSLTQDSVYANLFSQSEKKVFADIRYLKEFQKSKHLDIEQLDSLIQLKVNVLQSLLSVQDQFRVQEAINKIENITSKTTSKSTKIQEEGEKYNIFQWKKKKEAQEAALMEETLSKDELERIANKISKIKEEELTIEDKLKAQELMLIRADNKVSYLINKIFDTFEEKELLSIEKANINIQQSASKTNRQIALVCIVMSLFILFMSYLIMNFVNKNNKYGIALRKSKLEAERLAEAKQRFVANMSHEIRTPMNAIVGFAEQMRVDNLTKEQKTQLETIQKSADHLLYLINEILDFSKLENQKLQLESINFNPSEIINEVASLFKSSADQKGLQLITEFGENYPEMINGDPYRLRQILLNLVSNSIKFTEKGSVQITTQVVSSENDKALIQYSVRDTGIGMNNTFMLNVFEEFEQEHSSTSRNYGGTGLGLAITKKLVELHNGNIYIDSDLGKGTTINIEIPYTLSTNDEAENIMSISDEVKNPFKGFKCLIVDDEPFNRALLTTILKKCEAEFSEAQNGQEAIDRLQNESFDIVFMDARMPIMDGITATRIIREKHSKDTLKIIATTAATEQEDKQQYLDAGMNGIIVKPFKERDLFVEVQKVIQNNSNTLNLTESPVEEKPSNNINMIDFSGLKELSGDDNVFYQDMLETFIQTSENGMIKMKEAIKNNSALDLANHAHKISSPCKHLNIDEMYRKLKSIESTCRQGEITEQCIDHVTEIESVFLEIREMINQEIHKINS